MNHHIFQPEEAETHCLIIFHASLTPAGQHSSWAKASPSELNAILSIHLLLKGFSYFFR